MSRTYAKLLTSIWEDDDFKALRVEDQRFYMLALSQPNINLAGVVAFTARRWANFSASTTSAAIRKSVANLVKASYLVVDADTEELLVRRFIRHDGILSSPNLIRGMARDWCAIVSPKLRQAFIVNLPADLQSTFPEGLPERFLKAYANHGETLPEGFGQPSPSRARALAQPDPEPDPEPLPPRPAGSSPKGYANHGEAGSGSDDPNTETPKGDTAGRDPLVDRLWKACHGRRRGEILGEAVIVVGMLKPHMADHMIDECIGILERVDPPVNLPRYLLKIAHEHGAERGVDVPLLTLAGSAQR